MGKIESKEQFRVFIIFLSWRLSMLDNIVLAYSKVTIKSGNRQVYLTNGLLILYYSILVVHSVVQGTFGGTWVAFKGFVKLKLYS